MITGPMMDMYEERRCATICGSLRATERQLGRRRTVGTGSGLRLRRPAQPSGGRGTCHVGGRCGEAR